MPWPSLVEVFRATAKFLTVGPEPPEMVAGIFGMLVGFVAGLWIDHAAHLRGGGGYILTAVSTGLAALFAAWLQTKATARGKAKREALAELAARYRPEHSLDMALNWPPVLDGNLFQVDLIATNRSPWIVELKRCQFAVAIMGRDLRAVLGIHAEVVGETILRGPGSQARVRITGAMDDQEWARLSTLATAQIAGTVGVMLSGRHEGQVAFQSERLIAVSTSPTEAATPHP